MWQNLNTSLDNSHPYVTSNASRTIMCHIYYIYTGSRRHLYYWGGGGYTGQHILVRSISRPYSLSSWSNSILYMISIIYCRNMSGHTKMGRPADRLEKMVLMINSYVVVVLYAKDDDFPCIGCYFLVYQFVCWYFRVPYRNRLLGIKRYLTYESTYEHTLVGILPEYLVSYNK